MVPLPDPVVDEGALPAPGHVGADLRRSRRTVLRGHGLVDVGWFVAAFHHHNEEQRDDEDGSAPVNRESLHAAGMPPGSRLIKGEVE